MKEMVSECDRPGAEYDPTYVKLLAKACSKMKLQPALSKVCNACNEQKADEGGLLHTQICCSSVVYIR